MEKEIFLEVTFQVRLEVFLFGLPTGKLIYNHQQDRLYVHYYASAEDKYLTATLLCDAHPSGAVYVESVELVSDQLVAKQVGVVMRMYGIKAEKSITREWLEALAKL